jgi:hypothetical protein
MITRNRPRVKPTRVSPRPPARFGAGLLPPICPGHESPTPLSDMAWHAATATMFEDLWDNDTELESRAEEFRALDRLERGLMADDTAEMIERTSLVGHRP